MRRILLPVFFVVALALSACGDTGDCDSSTDTTGQGVTASAPAVVESTNLTDEHKRLSCGKELSAIEIGIGTHTEPNANYTLTQEKGSHPDEDVQVSVTLTAKPPTGVVVPSAIVHTTNSPDRELKLNVGADGEVTAQLITANYAWLPTYYEDYPINSITLCTKATS